MNCKSLYCIQLSLRNKNVHFVYYAVYYGLWHFWFLRGCETQSLEDLIIIFTIFFTKIIIYVSVWLKRLHLEETWHHSNIQPTPVFFLAGKIVLANILTQNVAITARIISQGQCHRNWLDQTKKFFNNKTQATMGTKILEFLEFRNIC